MGERGTPGPAAPHAGSRPGLSVGAGFAAGCLTTVVAVCVIGGAVAWWLASRVGLVAEPSSAGGSGLGALVVWAWVLLLVVAGHAAVSWWAWRTRPGITRLLLTQVPHAVVYVGAVAWWWSTRTALYLLWLYATLSAIGWVTVWFLRAPEVARRAVVYLSALGLLVAVNTAGVLSLAWRDSNGFGWRGQTTPWAAFIALSATSCMTRHPFYDNGSNTIPADCPSGPGADFFAGDYDETAFDNNTCGQQPRAAFTKWWDWNRQYQLQFELDWTAQETVIDGREIPPPYPEDADGNAATIRYLMSVERVSNTGAANPYQMHADKLTETWTVAFEPVALGGWKVCRIDVADPITATFTALDR